MLLIAVFGGCGAAKEPEIASDTNAGGEDMPAWCAEDHRETVTDPTVAAPDITFTAQSVIDAGLGDFAGRMTFIQFDHADVATTLTLSRTDAPIEAVYYVTEGGGDTGMASGAPAMQCDPSYAIPVAGTLIAEELLAETLDVSVDAASPEVVSFVVGLPLEEINGAARPVDIVPEDWASVRLAIDARLDTGAWMGSLTWQASSEAARTAEPKTSAESDTGEAGVSGMTEGYGSFSLTRP